jgi:hypothetical protein
MGDELSTTVENYGCGKAVDTENVGDEEGSELGSGEGLDSWDKVSHFGETVDDHEDGVAAVGEREFDDEIHRDVGPGTVRNVERLEKTERLMTRSLDTITSITSLDVVADVAANAGPG